MRKIRSAVAAAAVATGMLVSSLAAGTANAADTYTISAIDRCATVSGSDNVDCIDLGTYATWSQSQVWINGRVFCNIYSGSVKKTWCGVGGGNGTGALNIGVNFTFSGVTGLYERMDIYAGGPENGPGCHTWGSNSDAHGITSWWDDYSGPHYGYECEYPA